MAVIALMNNKGGVGKTTSAINLAAQSSRLGRTLLVDVDKQANLTNQYLREEPREDVRNLFLGKPLSPIEVGKNLHLLPSSLELAGIEMTIQNELSRESILKNALEPIVKNFDHVFIDCPPEISLVTVNALVATDYVIIPVKAARFSMEGIEGMVELASKIKLKLNPDLHILGVLVTQYNDRLKVSKNIMKEVKDNGWDGDVFDTMIRDNTAIENSQFYFQDIFQYDRRSNGANDYAKLGQEVQKRIKKHQKQLVSA